MLFDLMNLYLYYLYKWLSIPAVSVSQKVLISCQLVKNTYSKADIPLKS